MVSLPVLNYVLDIYFLIILSLCFAHGRKIAVQPNSLSERYRDSDFLDFCLDGSKHLPKPRKEPELSLSKYCSQYANRSCCSSKVASNIDNSGGIWYGLNIHHCGTKQLSQQCTRFFLYDSCFYECSPDVGPWTVQVSRAVGRQRFFGVPLCASECWRWWQACSNDLTCVQNWATDFAWNIDSLSAMRQNQCPENSSCRTFKQVYSSHVHFCNTVFDHSWKVVNDSMPCMKFSDSGGAELNYHVSKQETKRLLQDAIVLNSAAVASTASSAYFIPMLCYIVIG